MIRGTSVIIKCDIGDIDPNIIDVAYLSIAQNNQVIVEVSEFTIEGSYMVFEVSQANTLELVTGRAEIQLRIRLTTGDALASNVVKASITKILKDGMI